MSLIINHLSTKTSGKDILKDVSLSVQDGEVHFILGPNGSGKSTLAKSIMMDKNYDITAGEMSFDGENLLKKTSSDIAKLGVFFSFQHPVEIDGVSNIQFLKAIINENRKSKNLPAIDTLELLNKVKSLIKKLEFSEDFLSRFVNKNFSGGEKKKNEILQMLLLSPSLIILDEIDSGVDVDSLKVIFQAINDYKSTHKCSIIIITHHMKLANLIDIDKFHIIKSGRLVLTESDKDKIFAVEQSGFKDF